MRELTTTVFFALILIIVGMPAAADTGCPGSFSGNSCASVCANNSGTLTCTGTSTWDEIYVIGYSGHYYGYGTYNGGTSFCCDLGTSATDADIDTGDGADLVCLHDSQEFGGSNCQDHSGSDSQPLLLPSVIDVGAGADEVSTSPTGAHIDDVTGGSGDDVIYTYGGADVVYGPDAAVGPRSIRIDSCTFTADAAGYEGGAIAQSSDLETTLTIERTTFADHDAGHGGGAIKLTAHDLGTSVTATMVDVDITDCHAEYQGGAISADGHQGAVDLVLDRATLTGNSTDGRGGALSYSAINDGFSAAITDSTFDGNLATENGGFIWCGCTGGEGITIDLTDSTVIDHDLGAAHLTSPLLLTSTNTDWGSGATDNVSYDIDLGSITYDAYGAGASFTCTGEDGTCY